MKFIKKQKIFYSSLERGNESKPAASIRRGTSAEEGSET